MKTKLVALFSIAFMTACQPTPNGQSRTTTTDNYSIVVIDGCEYVEYDKGVLDQRVYSLTHKGNCKNPIHSTK